MPGHTQRASPAPPRRQDRSLAAARAVAQSGLWRGRRVLVTGHTGFKGAWLCLWLQALGARVCGVSLAEPPTAPCLYELARVGEGMEATYACDVRDAPALARAVADARAEVVFHLAAQPLVRRSLREPALTYAVNALGTANLLDAVLACPEVRAVVAVTSDKCYAPSPRGAPHREEDPLGGEDPYSSSKACAELVVAAYRASYFAGVDPRAAGPLGPGARTQARLASARAGNVFGGGDFGADRLLPDLFRAALADEPVRLRNPAAVRPWQHVLCPLAGYLLLAQALLADEEAARAWNFGPPPQEAMTVRELVERVSALWPGGIAWERDEEDHPPENPVLRLDSTRARSKLGWEPPVSLQEGIELTAKWFSAYQRGADMRAATLAQIETVTAGGGLPASATEPSAVE